MRESGEVRVGRHQDTYLYEERVILVPNIRIHRNEE